MNKPGYIATFWTFFKKRGLSSFVAFATIAGLLIGVYENYLRDQNPEVFIDVLSNANVIDVKAELGKLEIFYDGVAISQRQETLRVITLRVINDSSKNVLKVYFDNQVPLGVRLSSGRIIEWEILRTSNEYLNTVLSSNIAATESALMFPSVILDAHDYFVVKILVLHPQAAVPEVLPVGKISSVPEIRVREPYKEKKLSFWTKVFSGALSVQFTRMIAYSIVALASLALVVAFLLLFEGFFSKMGINRRRKDVEAYKKQYPREFTQAEEFIFSFYAEADAIELLRNLMNDKDELRKSHSNYRDALSQGKKYDYLGTQPNKLDLHELKHAPGPFRNGVIHVSLVAGLIEDNGNTFVPDTQALKTLNDFVAFLKEESRIRT
jgi:hypothetical protein